MPRAGSWALPRGRTRTTPIPDSPEPGFATRCCHCSKRCWAAGWPRRWPAPRRQLREDTELIDTLATHALPTLWPNPVYRPKSLAALPESD